MLRCERTKRISLTPGFLLLISFLLYLDDGAGVFPWVALSAFFHECGHTIMAVLFHGKIERLRLSATGMELKFTYKTALSYWKENVVTMAGPTMSLIVGAILLCCGKVVAGIMSIGLGGINLIPALPLDGGRLLFNLTAEYFGPDVAENVLTVSGGICSGIMLGVGAIAAEKYANITIIVGAVWLFWCTMKGQMKKT